MGSTILRDAEAASAEVALLVHSFWTVLVGATLTEGTAGTPEPIGTSLSPRPPSQICEGAALT